MAGQGRRGTRTRSRESPPRTVLGLLSGTDASSPPALPGLPQQPGGLAPLRPTGVVPRDEGPAPSTPSTLPQPFLPGTRGAREASGAARRLTRLTWRFPHTEGVGSCVSGGGEGQGPPRLKRAKATAWEVRLFVDVRGPSSCSGTAAAW